MNRQERILINHVASRLFVHLSNSHIFEDEWKSIALDIETSVEARERPKKLSETPLEQFDEESRSWLQELRNLIAKVSAFCPVSLVKSTGENLNNIEL